MSEQGLVLKSVTLQRHTAGRTPSYSGNCDLVC